MLDDIEIRSTIDLMVQAAQKASLMIRDGNSRQPVQEFSRDVKINADFEINKFVVNFFQQNSRHQILSEEGGTIDTYLSDGYYFVLDPLDGSLNYSRSLPLCCISIGFWFGLVPLAGVVYDFNNNELYQGIVGKGAWMNNKEIACSSIGNKSDAVLCTGFPTETDFSEKSLLGFVENIREYKKVRLLGSAALSLAYLAAGRVDAYQENDIAIWDVAAGIAICLAAGGAAQFEPTKKNRFSVYASNNVLN